MSTFLDMQNNIANYLMRSDLTQEIQLAINRAIRIASRNRYWFDESVGAFNTVAGTQSYSTVENLPENIRNVDYVRLTVSSTYYELIQRDINYIITANVNDNESQPTDWAFFEQKIWLYPTPNLVYPVTIYFHKAYPDLVNANDENDFTTNPEAEEYIENYALYWLYKKVILDREKAEEYRVLSNESMKILQSITAQLTGMNGAVMATGW